MDGLKPYQTAITEDTLYGVTSAPRLAFSTSSNASEQIAPNIEINGGNAADVYGSQGLPDAPPTGMTKLFDGLNSIAAFTLVPNYLYVTPVGAATGAIILSGIKADEV